MMKGNRLTVLQRAAIIREIEAGLKAVDAANKYKISVSSISRMLKKKDNILEYSRRIENNGNFLKKKINNIEDTPLDSELYHWFTQMRDNGMPVSGQLIREQALLLNLLTNGDKNFKASNGWLSKWKKRHRISLTNRNKKLSGNAEESTTIPDDQDPEPENEDDHDYLNDEVPIQNNVKIQLEKSEEETITSEKALQCLDIFQNYYQTLNCDSKDLVMLEKFRYNVRIHALSKVKLPS